jgi:hypothetical protein
LKHRPDFEIVIIQDVNIFDFTKKLSQEPKLSKLLNAVQIEALTRKVTRLVRMPEEKWLGSRTDYDNYEIAQFAVDPRDSEYGLSNMLSRSLEVAKATVNRRKEETKLAAIVKDLERDTEAIPETVELRNKLIENVSRLDKQMKEMTAKTEENIDALRKTVGAATDFQDWKVLVTDVERLSKEHVPKEVFESKVNELMGRIDALSSVKEAYDKVLQQQSKLLEQQSSFMTWLKYATVGVPVAIVLVPVIELLIRHALGIA